MRTPGSLEQVIGESVMDKLASNNRSLSLKRLDVLDPVGTSHTYAGLRWIGLTSNTEITTSAAFHGRDLLIQGRSVSQVVHGYGDVCQSVTELAVERDATISAQDFRTLNRCLDDAIAGAVTEYGREREENQSALTLHATLI
jgi:hypothetical protein